MFVFGGGAPNPTPGPCISLYCLDLCTREWTDLTNDTVGVTRGGEDTEGSSLPCPRRSHTCVLYLDTVFMCGGTDGDIMLDDLWALHVPTLTWTVCGSACVRVCVYVCLCAMYVGASFRYLGVCEEPCMCCVEGGLTGEE